MKILMISHAFPPTFGGVESHLWDISTRLVKRGHDVCCLVGGEEFSKEEIQNLKVIRNPSLSVQNLLLQRKGFSSSDISAKLHINLAEVISNIIAEFTPTLVHIHNSHHFAPELALALFTHTRHIPLINGVHDRVGENLFDEVMDYAWDHVLYASHYLKKSIPTVSDSSVQWLGIDLTDFSAQGPTDKRFAALERPIIFHPARLLRWKGVEVGLRAFIEIRNKLGKGTLVLCSSEKIVDNQTQVRELKRELVALAEKHNVAHATRFLTFDRSKIASAYRASDLIWYPTIEDEPFGLVPLEAMACGTPLVVSHSGGMMESVIDGETGLIVDKNNHIALANAAIELLTNKDLRVKLTGQGQKHVAMFDGDSYVSRLEKLYREVASI